MSRMVDLTGQRFGRLVVKGLSDRTSGKRKRTMWLCDCDCGTKDIHIMGEKLRSGHTRSCGCLIKIVASIKKKNHYDLSGEYGIGYTSQGQEFYFDKEDYDKIKEYTWCVDNGYIATRIDNRIVYLHRFIMNAPDGINVDHIKHCKYDNRKSELRLCNQTQNMRNQTIRSDNTSGITGVSYYKKNNKWAADIVVCGKTIHLGMYDNKEDAINARKQGEQKYFEEWSYDQSMKGA